MITSILISGMQSRSLAIMVCPEIQIFVGHAKLIQRLAREWDLCHIDPSI
jgi:hypothetical protein